MTSTERPARRATTTRQRSWSLALASSALAVFVWFGSQRNSAGPDAGTTFSGKATVGEVQSGATFRVGTFNIHSGRGRDGRTDLARVAELLRPADFVGLNEVRGAAPFNNDDQAEVIGGALECAWLFAPAEQRWWNQFYGNAVVSDLAVRNWQRIPLPRKAAKSFRNIVLVTADLGNERIRILCTHLERSSTADRIAQLQAVSNLFLALQPPVILLGDLNTVRADEHLQPLLTSEGVVDALAKQPQDDPRRIDWILLRGLEAVAAGHDDTGASDHPYYWADLRLVR